MAQNEQSVRGNRLILGPGYIKVDGRRIPGVDIGNKTFYVSSVTGVAGRDGLTPSTALATIAGALSLCTANQGDVIILMPKHAETITAAGGIDFNKAGVTVIGTGVGSQRATLTYTTADTATVLVSAADILLENILFVGNFANVAAAIDVSATGVKLRNLEFRDTDSTHNFLTPIKVTSTTNNAADGLEVSGVKWSALAAGALEFIELNGNLDRLLAKDCVITSAGTASTFLLSAGTKVQTNALISNIRHQMAGTSGDLFIDNGGSANTGIIDTVYLGNLDTSGAQTFGAATGYQFFNCWATSTSTEQGGIAQAADTPLS